jgi:acetate kinase
MSTEPLSPTGILTLNAGSASLKFALFRADEPSLSRVLSGKVERIGLPETVLTVTDVASQQPERCVLQASDHAACVPPVLAWLERHASGVAFSAVGHRIVHGGMRYSAPQWVAADMLDELRRLSPFDPEHLPAAIGLIEGLAQRYPHLPQVACFDTAFHHDMPRVARLLPIPRRYEAMGVQRYGFHGLSYAFLLEELARVAGQAAAQGRVVLAHLGNGASMAAVHHGHSIDTTMGFTPTAGLPMSTRSGDLDPGVAAYLSRSEGMNAEQFYDMVTAHAGLLGVSETSPDIRDLLARESSDVRAAEALALFCYEAKKRIGALAAALGGLDTLVFAGGIGENAAVIRSRICEGLGFLGIDVDAARNNAHAPIITTEGSHVTVHVIRTDEELQIARAVLQLLGHTRERTA